MPASSTKALLGAVAADLAVAGTKFLVGSITSSTVMVVEGIHSLVDCGNSALMVFGTWRSRRAPDDEHPFGYGMELYFWSFVVAMAIFGGGGCVSIYEGVQAFLHPRVVTKVWPNYLVIAAAVVFEGSSLVIGIREFAAYRREKRFVGSTLAVMRASKDPAIFVTILEDTAALAGLLVAALGLTLGHYWRMPAFDAAASIVIGLILFVEAGLLGVECRGLIIGEAARPLVIESVKRVAARHDRLGALEELRTLQLGPAAVLVVLQMRFAANLAPDDLTKLARQLELELIAENPSIKHVAFYLGALEKPWRAARGRAG